MHVFHTLLCQRWQSDVQLVLAPLWVIFGMHQHVGLALQILK